MLGAMHPNNINIDGQAYTIQSDEVWRDVSAQLENFIRTGRVLLRIKSDRGESHVLVTDGTSLNFWLRA